jgi:ADP-dependent phosphofructokinase/glucokinase
MNRFIHAFLICKAKLKGNFNLEYIYMHTQRYVVSVTKNISKNSFAKTNLFKH